MKEDHVNHQHDLTLTIEHVPQRLVHEVPAAEDEEDAGRIEQFTASAPVSILIGAEASSHRSPGLRPGDSEQKSAVIDRLHVVGDFPIDHEQSAGGQVE